jgi:hypothetical protein
MMGLADERGLQPHPTLEEKARPIVIVWRALAGLERARD